MVSSLNVLRKLKHSIHQQWHVFEQFVVDVIYERYKDGHFAVSVFRLFLLGLSYVFSGIVQVRYWLYLQRVFRSQPLGCWVVVVGNLTVGGTGKTPIVEKFARSLTERGRRVAILSRGYKSKEEPAYARIWRWITHGDMPPPKIVSDGVTVFLDSEQAGDEPFMLARNLPGVVVLVDKNRVKAGYYAIKHYGVDTLILDDGFQYLPLKSHLNLLLIDKTNPFGNGELLPRGILREPISHLSRASYIFLTKSSGQEDAALLQQIRRYSQADIIECSHQPQYLKKVNAPEQLPLSVLQGARIAVLSGIASPVSFEGFLTNQGAVLVHSKRFLDHHRFTEDELADFFEAAAQANAAYIVTTEKDAVRITQDFQWPIPCYYLRMEVAILKGAKDFEAAVQKVCGIG